MWGGPTPHNLVTLSLCCTIRTCSEVPISSSDRDTTRLGRGDHILLPSVIPAQVHNEKYPYDWVSAPHPTPPDALWDHAGDTTHLGCSELKKKDYGSAQLYSKMTIPTINYGSITKHYMIFNHSLEK